MIETETSTTRDELIQRLPPLPNNLTIDYARKWVAAAGEDLSPIEDDWCWRELAAEYPHLLELWFAFLERATTGDVAMAAYYAAEDLGMPNERAFQVIERATTGDPAEAAYLAAQYLGMPNERAFSIIERATAGNPAVVAYLAARYLGMDRERAFRIIERATTGEPARAAYWAVRDLGMDPERAVRVIERAYEAGLVNEQNRDALVAELRACQTG